MKKTLLVVTLLIILSLFTACSSNASSKSERWEYKVISSFLQGGHEPSIQDVSTKLNKLGEEGWELVSDSDGGSVNHLFILKRRLP